MKPTFGRGVFFFFFRDVEYSVHLGGLLSRRQHARMREAMGSIEARDSPLVRIMIDRLKRAERTYASQV